MARTLEQLQKQYNSAADPKKGGTVPADRAVPVPPASPRI